MQPRRGASSGTDDEGADTAAPTPTQPDPAGDPAVSVFARGCLSRSMLEDVTSKWGVLALLALLDSPARFSALRRRVEGVSERMLSQTLQALERDGLLVREVQSAIPPRVEYSLTPLGTRAATALHELASTLESHATEVITAQRSQT